MNLLKKWIDNVLPGFRRWLDHWTISALVITIMACSLYSRNAESAEPGYKFQDCPQCPEMVVVPPGSFQMGSPIEEKGRYDYEGPVHKVTIDYMFAVGVYEVTFSEWDYCVEQKGCDRYGFDDYGWGRGSRPVIDVNWYEAKGYVDWLSQKTGKPYRLLTEAEWEYAARAGTAIPFHFGNAISTDQANYKDSGFKQTTPVGTYKPNSFGLHDVHGNVWEWVEDCWHGNYEGAPADGSAWTEGGDCYKRVLRGGSWYNSPQHLRSAYRNRALAVSRVKYDTLHRRINYHGFRVALTLTP